MLLCNSDYLSLSQLTVLPIINRALIAFTVPQTICRLIDFPTTQREISEKQAVLMQINALPAVVQIIALVKTL